jgi:hypothetical protein
MAKPNAAKPQETELDKGWTRVLAGIRDNLHWANMKPHRLVGLGVGLLLLVLALDEANEWRHDLGGKGYTQARTRFVHRALSNAGPVDTLVLGDSISESTWLYDVCGKTFNASVAGAKIGNVASLAPIAIQRTRPKVIVLEVGANHFHTDARLTRDFKHQYVALIRSLPARKILVGVPNSPAASSFVRSLASHIDAAYVEPATGKLTRGGVHPTRDGAAVYRQRLEKACVSLGRRS